MEGMRITSIMINKISSATKPHRSSFQKGTGTGIEAPSGGLEKPATPQAHTAQQPRVLGWEGVTRTTEENVPEGNGTTQTSRVSQGPKASTQ